MATDANKTGVAMPGVLPVQRAGGAAFISPNKITITRLPQARVSTDIPRQIDPAPARGRAK